MLLFRNFSDHLFANVSLPDNTRKLFFIVSFSFSSESIVATDTALLTLFQMNSIGFRSGEYGGRNISLIFSNSAVSKTIPQWCDLKLSGIMATGFSGFLSLIPAMKEVTFSLLERTWKFTRLFPLIA